MSDYHNDCYFYGEITDRIKLMFLLQNNFICARHRHFVDPYAFKVWVQYPNGEVRWVKRSNLTLKDRISNVFTYSTTLTEEDLKEFTWVKLQAHNI